MQSQDDPLLHVESEVRWPSILTHNATSYKAGALLDVTQTREIHTHIFIILGGCFEGPYMF